MIHNEEIKKLDEPEKLILTYFSILPSIEILAGDFFEFTQIKDESLVEYFDVLFDLSYKGLLVRNKSSYLIEPEVKEVVIEILNPDAENCAVLIDYFSEKITQYKSESKKSLQYYLIFAESIINSIKAPTKSIATLANNIAVAFDNNGNTSKSIAYIEKAIEIQKTLDRNNSDLAFYYNNLAIACRKKGEYKKSVSYSIRSIEINEKSPFVDSIHLVNSYNILSTTYDKLKNYPKAIEYSLKAIHIGERVLEKKNPKLAGLYYDVAVSYYNSINFGKAKYYIDQAVDLYKKIYPFEHPALKDTLRDQKIFGFLYTFENILFKYGKTIFIILTLLLLSFIILLLV